MSDKTDILAGAWVPCRICEAAFRRKRETARYCQLPAEGGFAKRTKLISLWKARTAERSCGSHKAYKTQQKFTAEAVPENTNV